MPILGISAFYHDSAAALVYDGQILGALEEERFSRIKHDASFPSQSIQKLLEKQNLHPSEIETVVFYEKPWRKMDRILHSFLQAGPKGFPVFLKSMPAAFFKSYGVPARLKQELSSLGIGVSPLYCEHHLSHAASAFLPSGFESAATLVVDGVGEWSTVSIGRGTPDCIELFEELHWPHSPGLFYSAITHFLGFIPMSGEYKLMGLAPYGEPCFLEDLNQHFLIPHEDGSFRIHPDFYGPLGDGDQALNRLKNYFGHLPRKPDEPLTPFHLNLASSAQKLLETVLLNLIRKALLLTRESRLCLAGGVALNCSANQILAAEIGEENLFVQPASSDAGGSLGAALWHSFLKTRKRPLNMRADLGTCYTPAQCAEALEQLKTPYQSLSEQETFEAAIQVLLMGGIVGWFEGSMEFGPRALGHRSILADPRRISARTTLNRLIKKREDFRPFAPCILEEEAGQWFEMSAPSPFMLRTVSLHEKRLCDGLVQPSPQGLPEHLTLPMSSLPAITHKNKTARVQTVGPNHRGSLRKLLRLWYQKTGCPVLLNTSFNQRGEPIVENPRQAVECYHRSQMHALYLEGLWIERNEETQNLPFIPSLEMTD